MEQIEDGIYIVNYCHIDCEPLKNIMRLPRDSAFALAKELAEAHPGETAFGRFADFDNYYALRMRQDRLLRDLFISLGGKPQEEHPLSFVLHGSDYLDEWFAHGRVTRLHLGSIPSECVSFTLGDSGAALERGRKLQMLTKEELLAQVAATDGGFVEYMRLSSLERHYIEVQLWQNPPFPAVP